MKTGVIAALTLAVLAVPSHAHLPDSSGPVAAPETVISYFHFFFRDSPRHDERYARYAALPDSQEGLRGLMDDIVRTKSALKEQTNESVACVWSAKTAAILSDWGAALTRYEVDTSSVYRTIDTYKAAAANQQKKVLLDQTADQLQAGCAADSAPYDDKPAQGHPWAPGAGWVL